MLVHHNVSMKTSQSLSLLSPLWSSLFPLGGTMCSYFTDTLALDLLRRHTILFLSSRKLVQNVTD